MRGIFISYRRDDSQGFAGRLADDLGDLFGNERVFRDIEIPVGSDFSDILHRAIAASDVLLVVIGRHWLAPADDGAQPRLFDPRDWVRVEIEAALIQHKLLVPVLVGGARMPDADALPDSIRSLGRIQAAVLSDHLWDTGVKALADRLCELRPALRRGRVDGGPPASTLRNVLEQISDGLADEPGQRRPASRPASSRPSLLRRFFGWLGRGVKQIVTLLLIGALLYAGMRLFGDQQLLDGLDAFEDRLQLGWQRLQGYLQRL